MDRFFTAIATRSATIMGQPLAFILSTLFIILWAISGRGLSSNGTENLHKGLQASSIPVAPGSRSGLNSPRATMSGMVKA